MTPQLYAYYDMEENKSQTSDDADSSKSGMQSRQSSISNRNEKSNGVSKLGDILRTQRKALLGGLKADALFSLSQVPILTDQPPLVQHQKLTATLTACIEGIKCILSLCSKDEATPPARLEDEFRTKRYVLPDHRTGRLPYLDELKQLSDIWPNSSKKDRFCTLRCGNGAITSCLSRWLVQSTI